MIPIQVPVWLLEPPEARDEHLKGRCCEPQKGSICPIICVHVDPVLQRGGCNMRLPGFKHLTLGAAKGHTS